MKKLLILLGIIILILSTAIIIKKLNTNSDTETQTTIEQAKVTSKEVVIQQLIDNFQVVSKTIKVKKSFIYNDDQWYGKKELNITLYGQAKMGFNIDEIKEEDITITSDNQVIIEMPEPVLISLELPYDKMEIKKEKGILRRDFTEKDRQIIYGKASEDARQELLNNQVVKVESLESNKRAIKKILLKIPNIKDISFK